MSANVGFNAVQGPFYQEAFEPYDEEDLIIIGDYKDDYVEEKGKLFDGLIVGKYHVDLANCAAYHSVECMYGAILLHACRLKNVIASSNIQLLSGAQEGGQGVVVDTFAEYVYSNKGFILWENMQISSEEVIGIEASKKVDLKKVRCKKAESIQEDVQCVNCMINTIYAREQIKLQGCQVEENYTFGSFFAEDCSLDRIFACGSIDLVNCTAAIINSTAGSISIKNSGMDEHIDIFCAEQKELLDDDLNRSMKINACNSVTLEGLFGKVDVNAANGKVIAYQCILKEIKAHDCVTLIDVFLDNCISFFGSIEYTCKQQQDCIALQAKEDIVIENIKVSDKVKSELSYIKATNCILSSVSAYNAVHFINTKATNVCLHTDGQDCLLDLAEGSIITGDLIIKCRKELILDGVTPVVNVTIRGGEICGHVSFEDCVGILTTHDKVQSQPSFLLE